MSNEMQFRIGPATAPDGSPYVNIVHLMGSASFSWGIPLDSVEKFLRNFRESVRAAATDLTLTGINPVVPGGNFALPDLEDPETRAAVVRAANSFED